MQEKQGTFSKTSHLGPLKKRRLWCCNTN